MEWLVTMIYEQRISEVSQMYGCILQATLNFFLCICLNSAQAIISEMWTENISAMTSKMHFELH